MGYFAKKAKKKKTWLVGVILVMLIYWGLKIIYITIVNDLAVEDGQYALIEERLHALTTENIQLQDEILQKSSLTYINEEAQREDFVPAVYVYLP